MSQKINRVFLECTSNNKNAYDTLYHWFIDQGIIIALATAKIYSIMDFNIEDAICQLSGIFLDLIRTYGFGDYPFDRYAMFLLRRRIQKIMKENSSFSNPIVISLDEEISSGVCLLDVISSSDYVDMNEKINTDYENMMFASRSYKSIKLDQKIKRLILLKEEGYHKKNIMKILNLTDGQYRYLLRLIFEFEHGKREIDIK